MSREPTHPRTPTPDRAGAAGGVLFDFHETLVQLRPSTTEVLSRALDVPVDRCRRAMVDLDARIGELRDQGRWPPPQEELWERVYAVLLDLLDVPGDPGTISRAMTAHYLDPAAYVVFPEVPDVLHELTARGLRVGIVSNTDVELWPILDHLGLADHVDVAVALRLHGLEKPDPAAFRMGVDGLGLPAERLWFVGDSLEEDMMAAAVGMTPVLVDRAGAHARVDGIPRVESLAALPDLMA